MNFKGTGRQSESIILDGLINVLLPIYCHDKCSLIHIKTNKWTGAGLIKLMTTHKF